jgi:lipoprotein LprG
VSERRLSRRTAALALALGLAVTGCSGSKENAGPKLSPDEAMAQAKKALDETSGVQLDLYTDNLPSNVSGVLSGSGVGTHAPAFQGSIKVQVFGAPVEVPIIAVGGKVYAKLFGAPYAAINPKKYGAPDPASLFSADHGLSGFLTSTTGLSAGQTVRGGTDNKEILTEYTGSLPASVVSRLIPSATGDDFTAVYTITEAGELREAKLTGEFYPGAGDVTYTVSLTNYGTGQDIKAP